MELRRADEGDRDDILAADRVCFPHDAPPDWEASFWWWLDDGGDVAAYCAAMRSPYVLGAAYLSRAGVLPEYRGCGLQVRLIRARLRWAKRLGCDAVVTDTLNNPASANSLIRCDFKLWEPPKPWAGSGALYWLRRF